MLDFQSNFTKNKKYQGKDSFSKHVPYGMLALGHYMVELPGFSEKFSKEFRYYLEWAETSLGKALEISAKEGVA
jgi:hypothetical protein